MPTMEFYLERAADARREADGAALANVRDRCLSAATAWDGMADRLRRTQEFRDAHVAARAETEAQLVRSLQPRQENESDHTTSSKGASGATANLPPAAP